MKTAGFLADSTFLDVHCGSEQPIKVLLRKRRKPKNKLIFRIRKFDTRRPTAYAASINETACGELTAFLLQWPGGIPTTALKVRLNDAWSEKPACCATSEREQPEVDSNDFACSIR